jgi:hypothetical protein
MPAMARVQTRIRNEWVEKLGYDDEMATYTDICRWRAIGSPS